VEIDTFAGATTGVTLVISHSQFMLAANIDEVVINGKDKSSLTEHAAMQMLLSAPLAIAESAVDTMPSTQRTIGSGQAIIHPCRSGC
jgi:hypothetical protein